MLNRRDINGLKELHWKNEFASTVTKSYILKLFCG
jgi:hypothetical protein